ncbi:MAG: adenylate/guanylate cyclase domain-containing protein [Nitrosopumilus sp.]
MIEDFRAQIMEQEMSNTNYVVVFSEESENYCIGMVDMVNSTMMAAELGGPKMSVYYQTFLNFMAKILNRFGGFVIKNIGDSLLYYFPESSKTNRKFGLMSCLECSLTMVERRNTLCKALKKNNLPDVDYRVSADYGNVFLIKTNNPDSFDMIGTPVNMCTKINPLAEANSVVIGGDLYTIVKHLDDYVFSEIKGYSLGFKHSYPIYVLNRK